MKITKEQLIGLIGESTYNNLKEMAQLGKRRKHGHATINQAGGQSLDPNFRRIFVNLNPQEDEKKIIVGTLKKVKNDPKYKHVGWRYFDRLDIYFIGKKNEINEFLTEHNLEVNKLLEESGYGEESGVKVRWSATSLPSTDPRREPFPAYGLPGAGAEEPVMTPDTKYKGKPITDPEAGVETVMIPIGAAERITRDQSIDGDVKPGLYSLMKEVFEGETLVQHMSKVGLPSIHVNERPYLNRHKKNNSNQKFEYATHTILFYKTQEEWYKMMLARIKGTVPSEELVEIDAHSRYKFNEVYLRHYESERGAINKPEATLTPIYKLNARDYRAMNLNICVEGILTIIGTMSEDQSQFSWSVTYNSKWGKKLEEEFRIEGGLKPDMEFSSTKTCDIEGDKNFDQKRVIIHNDSIANCFREALNDVAEQIMSVRPATAIRKALPTQGQIDVGNPRQD